MEVPLLALRGPTHEEPTDDVLRRILAEHDEQPKTNISNARFWIEDIDYYRSTETVKGDPCTLMVRKTGEAFVVMMPFPDFDTFYLDLWRQRDEKFE
jgi:hypothetical protein